MAQRYRLTGEWPHPNLLSRMPNWENALDEEHLPDQDETTIRPASNQRSIDADVPFAAADAWLPDGRFVCGILEFMDDVAGFNICLDGTWYRLVRTDAQWEPFVQSWLAESDRSPSLKIDDTSVFPIKLASAVPLSENGQQIRLVIQSDGSETTW